MVGPGDDAAVVRPRPRWDLVMTCDAQVAGRHFLPEWMTPRQIGRRIMEVNLSDVAAMGADPLYALVSLGLPASMLVAEVESLHEGFADALEPHGAAVIGGNLSGVEGAWFCDIAMTGQAPRNRALLRRHAQPGDRILVTGSPGRSAAGLRTLRAIAETIPKRFRNDRTRLADGLDSWRASRPWSVPLVSAYLDPRAQVEAGRLLRGSVNALIDLSDGLPGDLLRVCEASGLDARIDAVRLPDDPELREAAAHFGASPLDFVLGPSDDYQLLMAVEASNAPRVISMIRRRTGAFVTDVGEFIERGSGKPRVLLRPPKGAASGRRGTPSAGLAGWDHFLPGPPNHRS